MVFAKKHFPLILLLFSYLIYALLFFRSFGITWDEQAVYERGKLLYESLIERGSDNRLLIKESDDDLWPTYNNAYAATLFTINQDESYEIYHLLNLLFGSLIFIFSYVVFYKKYKKPLFAVIAPLFLVLNPRFFGDLAANPKDMSFAIFYFMSIASIYLLSDSKQTWLRILILGLLFGASQSIRSIGLTLYFILFFYDFYFWRINLKSKLNLKSFSKFISRELIVILLIFGVSVVFTLLTWPYLRTDFLNHFLEILQVSGKFPWDGEVLFLGEIYKGGNIPISYLPVWLIIGVPIFILICSAGSLFYFKKFKHNEIFFLSIVTIAINITLYFLLKPVIYNGLRHYLFLLPFLSVLGALFVIEVYKLKNIILKRILFGLIIINSVLIIVFNLKYFPYNYIYFNELAGGAKNASSDFETDYWAASSLEALNWLTENKKEGEHKVYTCGLPLIYIEYYPRNFTWVGNSAEADFAVCPASLNEHKTIDGNIIHTIERSGIPLSYIVQVN